jgi:SagB-type dehydrogenase family enzyme
MRTISVILFLAIFSGLFAQSGDTIMLPQPIKSGGPPLMNVLNERHSSRNFKNTELTMQQLSDLLWAAFGVNRPDGRRTAPSSHNHQEVDIYIATGEGVFSYNAPKNNLVKISGDDMRSATGTQGYVKDAAVDLVYVLDKSRVPGNNDQGKLVSAAISVGAMVQNVYLYCASEGLGCVVRGSFNKEQLANVLRIDDQQEIIITQSAGPVK